MTTKPKKPRARGAPVLTLHAGDDVVLLELIEAMEREASKARVAEEAWVDIVALTSPVDNDGKPQPTEDTFSNPDLARLNTANDKASAARDAFRDRIADTPARTMKGAIAKLAAADQHNRLFALIRPS